MNFPAYLVRTSFSVSILVLVLLYINQFLKYIFITINVKPPLQVLGLLIPCSATCYVQCDKFISFHSVSGMSPAVGEGPGAQDFLCSLLTSSRVFENSDYRKFLEKHKDFQSTNSMFSVVIEGSHSVIVSLPSDQKRTAGLQLSWFLHLFKAPRSSLIHILWKLLSWASLIQRSEIQKAQKSETLHSKQSQCKYSKIWREKTQNL